MDIHRCRFIPYPVSTINALAFSHQSSSDTGAKSPSNLRLALGRANGDIEIWNPLRGNWHQETIIRGGKDRSIEGLVWTQDLEHVGLNGKRMPGKLRLFSIGYSTVITEWDLALGRPVRHSSSNYGEIWCLAAQPKRPATDTIGQGKQEENQEQHLVAGCADGTLVINSTAEGELRFLRTLTRSSSKKSRVLSVAFLGRGLVVAGYADSTIRVFSIHTGKQISIMSLSVGPREGPSEVLVWSVKTLPNGNIVSGDSTGEVKFWDGKTFTLLQRIKSHRADILDITTSADGATVISGGMDRRTTIYRQTGSTSKGALNRWSEIGHQRFHSHDVKTMASYESKEMSIVASGGLDTTPIIIPLQQFGREHARSLSSLPQIQPLQSAQGRRLVMSWWDREVILWRVAGQSRHRKVSKDTFEGTEPATRKLVARILFKGEESLTSASLASDGSYLAVATISNVKIFRLRQRKSQSCDALKAQNLELSHDFACQGAKIVQFSPDFKWLLVIRPDDSIKLIRLRHHEISTKASSLEKKVASLIRQSRSSGKTKWQHGHHGAYDRTISRVAFSADSHILVAADLSGFIDSWVLEGHEDLTQDDDIVSRGDGSGSSSQDDNDSDDEDHPTIILGQHWIRNPAATLLPKLPTAPLILCFRPNSLSASSPLTNGNTAVHPTRQNPHPHSHDLPNGEDRLFTLTIEHQIFEYDVLAGKLSDWTRRNPPAHLPLEFREIRDRAIGLLWDVGGDKERVWFYGSSWLFMFDLSEDFPDPDHRKSSSGASPLIGTTTELAVSRKRKRGRPSHGERRDLKKQDTGAGSRIPQHELRLGVADKFRKSQGLDQDDAQWISLDSDMTRAANDDYDDDEDGENEYSERESALVSLRRGNRDEIETNNHNTSFVNGSEELATDGEQALGQKKLRSKPVYWHTYKYRPILGIVSLGGEDDKDDQVMMGEGEGDEPLASLEVVLVERPLWDVELPDKLYGDQEWDN